MSETVTKLVMEQIEFVLDFVVRNSGQFFTYASVAAVLGWRHWYLLEHQRSAQQLQLCQRPYQETAEPTGYHQEWIKLSEEWFL